MERDFQTMTLEDLQNTDLATLFLGSLLYRRELVLILGAGVSAPIGLPTWSELVQYCETAVGIPAYVGPPRPSEDLMRAMDVVFRTIARSGSTDPKAEYFRRVREGLYTEEMRGTGAYPNSIIQERLLIALGALVMASARGSVADVFTFNFDDLLEWYLHLHGFRTQVVSHFPARLRGDADLTVFHPHGFVPLVQEAYEQSEFLVLTHSELVSRVAGGYDQPWPTLLSSRLLAKRFLAVGSSMRDFDLDVLLSRAKSASGGDGPLGFVVEVGIPQDRREELMSLGVVPINLTTYDEVPDFLLGVCRESAAART